MDSIRSSGLSWEDAVLHMVCKLESRLVTKKRALDQTAAVERGMRSVLEGFDLDNINNVDWVCVFCSGSSMFSPGHVGRNVSSIERFYTRVSSFDQRDFWQARDGLSYIVFRLFSGTFIV